MVQQVKDPELSVQQLVSLMCLGSIPGSTTYTCHGCRLKKKKKKKKRGSGGRACLGRTLLEVSSEYQLGISLNCHTDSNRDKVLYSDWWYCLSGLILC